MQDAKRFIQITISRADDKLKTKKKGLKYNLSFLKYHTNNCLQMKLNVL